MNSTIAKIFAAVGVVVACVGAGPRPARGQAGGSVVFVPIVAKAEPDVLRGITGRLKRDGSPLAGAMVRLTLHSNVTGRNSDISTATTTASGRFVFDPPLPLKSPDTFSIYYYQADNPGVPGSMFEWQSTTIYTFKPGMLINLGDTNVADISVLTPADGEVVVLPARFAWVRRDPNETYSLSYMSCSGCPFSAQTVSLSLRDPEYVLKANYLKPEVTAGGNIRWFVGIDNPDGSHLTSSAGGRIFNLQ